MTENTSLTTLSRCEALNFKRITDFKISDIPNSYWHLVGIFYLLIFFPTMYRHWRLKLVYTCVCSQFWRLAKNDTSVNFFKLSTLQWYNLPIGTCKKHNISSISQTDNHVGSRYINNATHVFPLKFFFSESNNNNKKIRTLYTSCTTLIDNKSKCVWKRNIYVVYLLYSMLHFLLIFGWWFSSFILNSKKLRNFKV